MAIIYNAPTEEEMAAMRDTALEDVNKAAADLISEAQGRYDYIAKWIEKEFQVALGTDDNAREEFLKEVYSAVEEQIGRIPYDYEKYTERELENYALSTKRLNEDTEKALRIAEEDQMYLKQQQRAQQDQDRQSQTEGLLSRGILTTSRATAGGIAGQAVKKLESSIGLENEITESDYQRNKDDIIRNRLRTQEDLDASKGRNITDITDKYRREAIDSVNSKDKQLESAQLNLEQQKAEIERQKAQQERQIRGSYGDLY